MPHIDEILVKCTWSPEVYVEFNNGEDMRMIPTSWSGLLFELCRHWVNQGHGTIQLCPYNDQTWRYSRWLTPDDIPILKIGLMRRTAEMLIRARITTLGALEKLSDDDLLWINGIGRKQLWEIDRILKARHTL